MLKGPFTSQGTLFGKGSLPVVERTMAFLEERHRLIAHNIANVETRYYKAQDLPKDEFHKLLKKSINARDEKHVKVFDFFHNSDVYPDWNGTQGYRVEENGGGILRHGDNNVDIDREVTKLARNQMMYRSMSRLAKKHYDLLRATIRETP